MTKQCKHCSKTFPVGEDDIVFYDRISPIVGGQKFSIPTPTHCPDCRLQRRLAVRNERNLYTRTCDLCKKNMIAQYPADSAYTVYCHDCYWSDKWDAATYALEYDFSKTFFEQFNDLQTKVPVVGLTNVSGTMENSEYVNYCGEAKNAYLCFASNWHENCMYGGYIWKCKDSLDCSFSTNLELCYECMDCDQLFNCKYLQQSQSSNNCILGFGLRGCSDCFGCVNLRSKQYCFFNKQLTQEEYTKRVQSIMRDEIKFKEAKRKFEDFALTFPRKYSHQTHCENSTGDGIRDCVNTYHSFDGYESENVKWMMNFPGANKDNYDVFGCAQTELSYECHGLFPAYHQLFSNSLFNGGKDSMYCAFSSGENLFGCVGLQKAKFSILNTSYSQSEYEALLKKIITHMQQTGEWGEFFPISISPFAYNTTVASNYFPVEKDTIISYGWNYREPDAVLPNKHARRCTQCGKNFSIIKQEEDYYQQHGIFIPSLCHNCRYDQRISSRKERALWRRQCMCTKPDHYHGAKQCPAEFETTYSPSRKELVYCEQCYQQEVL